MRGSSQSSALGPSAGGSSAASGPVPATAAVNAAIAARPGWRCFLIHHVLSVPAGRAT
jgi:hypothetical protein